MRLVGLISDTHNRLRPDVFDHFRGVDLILHAGDVGEPDILIELAAIAPVRAVFGNTDGGAVLRHVTERLELDLSGWHTVVTHGHEIGSPTPAGLAAAYPEADVVVFGHTHRATESWIGERLFVNPGSAGAARFGLAPSIGLLDVSGDSPRVKLIELRR